MNRLLYTVGLNIALSSFIFANTDQLPSSFGPQADASGVKNSGMQDVKKGKAYFEYDAPNGWWWYKEKVKQKGKEIEIQTKMTKKEKLNFDKKKKTNELLKEQVDLLKDVKKRLIYAFPYVTPIYTKDERTGKKCLTNSSEHCFVLPIQAEAQRVPVMASWLKAPSPTNSKKWLRWEAKYFNHLQKISLGNRFAYLSGGVNAYPTNTVYSMGDSIRAPLSVRAREIRKRDIIKKVGKKLEILVFLGKTSVLDSLTEAYREVTQWKRKEFVEYNVHFIFESQTSLDFFEKSVKTNTGFSNRNTWKKIKERKLVFVSKKYFEKFNIKISPSVVAIYKTDKKATDEKGKETGKNEMIWQTILTSNINPVQVKAAIFRFLEYNGILHAKELAIDTGLGSLQKNVTQPEPDITEEKIYKDQERINNKEVKKDEDNK